MKKKTRRRIVLGIFTSLVISIVILYFYYADQVKQRGFEFGNQLQSIQDELKDEQLAFDSLITQLNENDLDAQTFIKESDTHISKLNDLLKRYDTLNPPDSFRPAVHLFELSTESQIQSDAEYIKWVETGDESHKFQSDHLFQEAFQYELSGLSLFNAAKSGISAKLQPVQNET